MAVPKSLMGVNPVEGAAQFGCEKASPAESRRNAAKSFIVFVLLSSVIKVMTPHL
jgi:hypothetical protein